ncbi:MAG TPA: hypothetical protein VH370_13565 [Humisphaera sp.]|jgi:hypothetical protein|nr:hypothetical protein [Humisphaera sp.]
MSVKSHDPGKQLTGRMIDGMSPAQKQKIIDAIERSTFQERDAKFTAPITRSDRARLNRLAGRCANGQ